MILSLDVGFGATGWSVFNNGNVIDCGVVKTERSKKRGVRTADETVMRAQTLVDQLRRIITVHGVSGIIGELPSGGSKSARAMRDMAAATCAIAGMIACVGLPCEWCTPTDVKLAATGNKTAGKAEVMDAIASRYGWPKTVKTVNTTASRGKNKGSKVPVDHVTYHVRTAHIDKSFAAGTFEHAADSMAAYLALRNGNLVKMFG